MKFRKTDDNEYDYIIRQKIKECTSAEYSIGVVPGDTDVDEKYAVVKLTKQLEDKIFYQDANIKSFWEAANDKSLGIEKVFLNINFKRGDDSRDLKFYIDLYDFGFMPIKEKWFNLIIERDGVIIISDGNIPSIMTSNIPVDIPRLVILSDKIVSDRLKKK